jgi:hypothetical protein
LAELGQGTTTFVALVAFPLLVPSVVCSRRVWIPVSITIVWRRLWLNNYRGLRIHVVVVHNNRCVRRRLLPAPLFIAVVRASVVSRIVILPLVLTPAIALIVHVRWVIAGFDVASHRRQQQRRDEYFE